MNTCAEPTSEEDLSVITTVNELIEFHIGNDVEKKNELKVMLEILNSAMLGLSEKHKIVYLTYKAYEQFGKNIPRSISKKLQGQLELTQNSIRVYKLDANKHVLNYLEQINVTK